MNDVLIFALIVSVALNIVLALKAGYEMGQGKKRKIRNLRRQKSDNPGTDSA